MFIDWRPIYYLEREKRIFMVALKQSLRWFMALQRAYELWIDYDRTRQHHHNWYDFLLIEIAFLSSCDKRGMCGRFNRWVAARSASFKTHRRQQEQDHQSCNIEIMKMECKLSGSFDWLWKWSGSLEKSRTKYDGNDQSVGKLNRTRNHLDDKWRCTIFDFYVIYDHEGH